MTKSKTIKSRIKIESKNTHQLKATGENMLWHKKRSTISPLMVFLTYVAFCTSGCCGQREIVELFYTVEEEVDSNTFIGNVLHDSNLSSIHPPDTINNLFFTFFKQPRNNTLQQNEYMSFSLDSKTAVLRTSRRLDREDVCPGKDSCVIKFDVVVRPVEYFSILRVIIHVLDINDNAPIFPMQQVVLEVLENTQVGSTLSIPVAIDKDSPSYSIQRYIILPDSRIYKDTKDQQFYSVYNSSKVDNFSFIYPSFAKDQLHHDSTKHHHHHYHHHNHHYFDQQTYNNGNQQKDNSNIQNPFQMTQGKGRSDNIEASLRLTHPLDREVVSSYYFIVEAVDNDDSSQERKTIERSILKIKLEVVDVNDNAPTFERSVYESSVKENVPIGSIIAIVKAVDFDHGSNGQITYEFSSLTNNAFGDVFLVNKFSGEVINQQSLDYEKMTFYLLTVVAQDQGPGSTPITVSVKIRVEDVNDNAPSISVDTLSSQFGVTKVQENSEVNTFVAHVSVNDLDSGPNGKVTCVLNILQNAESSTHYNQFEKDFDLRNILESEYQIMTTRVLDREEQSKHRLEVECFDSPLEPDKVLVGKAQIDVEVADVNDNPPYFQKSTYVAELYENNYVGSFVITFSAHDQDEGRNADLKYSIRNPSSSHSQSNMVPVQSMLKIESKTGVLTTLVTFDREVVEKIEFVVVVADMGYPSLSSSATATLLIADVNDVAPVFGQEMYMFKVMENKPKEIFLGRVQARDEDLGVNGEVFYELIPFSMDYDNQQSHAYIDRNTDFFNSQVNQFNDKNREYSNQYSDLFLIDSTSGVIMTTTTFDREARQAYHLMVKASDSSFDTPLTSTCVVSIVIDDQNDNPPLIKHPSQFNKSVEIATSSPVGYFVFQVVASDIDVGENARLSFSLTQSDNFFEIDEELGTVYVSASLEDQEDTCQHLNVNVHDNGQPSLTTSGLLLVCLNDSESILFQMGKYLWRNGYSQASNPYRNLTIVIILAIVSTFITIALIAAILILNKQDDDNKNKTRKEHYLIASSKNGTTSSELQKAYTTALMPHHNTSKPIRPWLDTESNFQKNVFKNEFPNSTPDKRIDHNTMTQITEHSDLPAIFADISQQNTPYLHHTQPSNQPHNHPTIQPSNHLYPSPIVPQTSNKEVDTYITSLNK